MMKTIFLQVSHPIGSPVLGIVIPALIFLISFLAAWLLYRHFAK
jgi:hypothetical protein